MLDPSLDPYPPLEECLVGRGKRTASASSQAEVFLSDQE